MRCAKHDEETEVSCGRCSTPVCPRCMVHTDVGVRCKNCGGDYRGKAVGASSRVIVLGAVVIAVIVLVGSLGSGLLGLNNNGPADFSDLGDLSAKMTAVRAVDPWIPDDGTKAHTGFRFVAIEVLEENEKGEDLPGYYSEEFVLTDSNNFVYGPIYEGGAEPQLPFVGLPKGKKAQGWVTFEVPASAEVQSLSNYAQDIPLPK